MKDWVRYTLREQRGIAFLVILLSLALLARFWPLPEVDHHIELMYDSKDSFHVSTDKGVRRSFNYKKKQRTWSLHLFDINYAKARELRQMGFSNDFISQWFAMKQEVGFVTTWGDFEKMNLLSASDFQEVKPFLDFSRYVKQEKQYEPRKKSISVVSINSADTSEFKQLPGIGTAFSRRIVKYREKLGGYSQITQLKEVYGVDSALFARIQLYLQIDSVCRKINVNSASVDELRAHPYITYKQAKAIVSYRSQHGIYSQLSDLNKLYVLDEKWLQKVQAYLYCH